MYAEISAAIASAKTALTIAKSAHDLSNYNELVSAISEVNTKLMNATVIALDSQEKQSALSNRIAELENQLREIKNWESKIERYELHEFATGMFAYALKQDSDSREPHHYLCAKCVNERKPTILQPNGRFLYCPVCDKSIDMQPSPHRASSTNTGNSWMSR